MEKKIYLEGIEGYRPPLTKTEREAKKFRSIFADKVRFRPERTEEKDRLR